MDEHLICLHCRISGCSQSCFDQLGFKLKLNEYRCEGRSQPLEDLSAFHAGRCRVDESSLPSWVCVCPPGSPNSVKLFIDRKVFKPQVVLQSVGHGDAGWAGANDDNIGTPIVGRHALVQRGFLAVQFEEVQTRKRGIERLREDESMAESCFMTEILHVCILWDDETAVCDNGAAYHLGIRDPMPMPGCVSREIKSRAWNERRRSVPSLIDTGPGFRHSLPRFSTSYPLID